MPQSIFDRITAFNAIRNPNIVKYKYKRMSRDAFRFFRGTCHLFYEDLAQSTALPTLPASPLAWVCGDLHLENFGSYKADNQLVYFDLTDFDEGCLAPAIWEIARFSTSIVVALTQLGFEKKAIEQACQVYLTAYAHTLKKGKARYIEPQTAKGIVRDFLKQVSENTFKTLLTERTETDDKNKIRLRNIEKRLLPLDAQLKEKLLTETTLWLKAHREERFHWVILDAGFRISGTSSIGIERYILLAQNPRNPKEMELLDMKQAMPSVIPMFMPTDLQPTWASEAVRIVAVQDKMQNTTPALLSPFIFDDKPFIFKEMQPMSDKLDIKTVFQNTENTHHVLQNMGLLTASAQLRSSGRQGAAPADDLIAFGADTTWQKTLTAFAFAYAQQVNSDFEQFVLEWGKQKKT
ncbi:MAG: DUF2252 family protein [Saprospiraceae bacterium]|nr:DUF2252 family protein [Saprospiraceae bacterium]